MSQLVRALAALGLLFGLAGCSQAPPESWDGRRSLLAVRTHYDPPATPPPAPSTTPQDPGCAQVLRLVDGFRQRMVQSRPPDGVLDTLTQCLLQENRTMDLVDLLSEASIRFPEDRALQLRLAGAFVRLGDSDEALRRIAPIRRVAPDDPEALFLEGLILSRRAEPTHEELTRARDAWRRLLEVAPDHQGLGQVPPATLRRELQTLEQTLGSAPALPEKAR
jgi:hypothetical protein